MKPEEKMLCFFVIALLCLMCLGIYGSYSSTREREKMTPACNVAGGKVIKTYDGEWVCIKSIKLEK
jgi:hypothetical protein